MSKKKKKRSRMIEGTRDEVEEATGQDAEEESFAGPEPARYDSNLKVGDRVSRMSITLSGASDYNVAKRMTGTVVYIHPQGRYHVVAFDVGKAVFRESFLGV